MPTRFRIQWPYHLGHCVWFGRDIARFVRTQKPKWSVDKMARNIKISCMAHTKSTHIAHHDTHQPASQPIYQISHNFRRRNNASKLCFFPWVSSVFICSFVGFAVHHFGWFGARRFRFSLESRTHSYFWIVFYKRKKKHFQFCIYNKSCCFFMSFLFRHTRSPTSPQHGQMVRRRARHGTAGGASVCEYGI